MKISNYFKGIVLSISLLSSYANATLITNGSFESGFLGWTTQDLSSPFYALQTQGSGVTSGFGLFSSSPTHGNFAAIHGFDGDGPGIIRIAQDITINNLSTIMFDYRAGWDLLTYGGSNSLERLFDVNIEVGGINLAKFNILNTGTTINFDTGTLTSSVDLSAFVGQTVSLSFDWFVPEFYTGPAFFQLDNVRSTASLSVPEPSTLAILTLSLLGLTSRRFKK